MNKNIRRGLVLVGAPFGVTGAMAAGPDMSPLLSAIHFDTVVAVVLSIAGMLAVVYVALLGARIYINTIRGVDPLPGYPEELLEKQYHGYFYGPNYGADYRHHD